MPRRTRSRLHAAISLTLLSLVPPLHANSYYFVGPTNSLFSDPNNWSDSSTGPAGTPPGNGDNAYLAPSGPFTTNVDGTPNNVFLANVSYVGQSSSPFTVLESTGSFHAQYIYFSPNTIYSLSGIASIQSDLGIGISSTTVSQSGGTLNSDSEIQIGSDSNPLTYSLSGGYLHGEDVRLGAASPISFIQTGGQVSGSYSIQIGANTTYTLSAGNISSEGAFVIGGYTTYSTTGSTFLQTGGSLSFTSYNTTNALFIDSPTSTTNAVYSLTNGSADFGSLNAVIASSHSGTLLQTGGTLSNIKTLTLASISNSSASYSLSAGSLSATTAILADQGSATFNQSGGISTFNSFTFANTPGSSATLNLTAGTLSSPYLTYASTNYIAYAGSATVNHSGGTFTQDSSYHLVLASQPGSSATYNLSGSAELNPGRLVVGDQGSATFNQTGGYLSANTINIAGTLNQSAGYAFTESVFLTNNLSPAHFNLSGGTFTANFSISVGAGTLSQSAGRLGTGDGLIMDSSTGNSIYTLSGGSFGGDYFIAGYSFAGTILQSGGSLDTGYACRLGYSAGSHGSYLLSGGTLTAVFLSVGESGSGTFTQTGGTYALDAQNGSSLILALNPGSTGSYMLSGGSIIPGIHNYNSGISVASAGAATFSQTGGSISVKYISLADAPNSTALYNLSDSGSITVQSITLADHGSATLNQTGGNISLTPINPYDPTDLTLATSPGSSATYRLSAGSLSAITATIADQGSATFSQTGGSASFSSFTFANTANSSATLNLSAGIFSLSNTTSPLNYIAYAGSTTVNQTGGTLSTSYAYPSNLVLASQPGSSAIYNLSAGLLDASANHLTVGDQGAATLNQTGGKIQAMQVQVAGTYNLSGGSLVSAYTTLDNPPSPAHFNLSGGALYGNHLFLKSATFTQSAGTIGLTDGFIVDSPTSSLYTLSGGTTGEDYTVIGQSFSGTAIQSGGQLTTDSLTLGQYPGSHGSYSLSAGTLYLPPQTYMTVGAAGSGTFVQSGGSVTINGYTNYGLNLAYLSGSSATYNLSAGTLTTTSTTVASSGSAYLLQTGGSLTTFNLTIAANPNSTGIYDLLAGSLSSSSITNHGTFYMQPPASLTMTGPSPTFTNTGSATLDGLQSWPANSLLTNTLVTIFHSDPGPNLHFSSSSPNWAPVLFDAPSLHFASVDLSSTTHATLAPTSSYLSTQSLTLADTAQLDLTTSTLLVDNGSLDVIRQYLHDQHLISTSADATHSLAYRQISSEIQVTLSLTGDANQDGTLDPDDYALIDRSFAQHLPNPHWTDGDFNYDGIINNQDYLLLDTSYIKAQGFFPGLLSERESQFGQTYISDLIASVPEPTSALACLIALPLLRRRKHSPPPSL